MFQAKRRRATLAIGALLLAAGAGCGGRESSRGLRLDPDLSRLVPADTLTMGGGRVGALLDAPLVKSLGPEQAAAQMGERFGLNPRQDLREFVFTHNGKDGLLLVRGSFRSQDLAARLAGKGAQKSEHRGKTIIGTARDGIAFLADGVAAGGPMPMLRETIERAERGEKLPERLAALARELPATPDLWLLTAGGTFNLPRGTNLANVDKVLGSLQTLTAWADLSKGVRVSAAGRCTDEAAAKRLQTQLRGLIGMGRLSTPDNQPDLLKVYDAIKVEQRESGLTLDFDVSQEVVERLRRTMNQ